MRILLVEDEKRTAQALCGILRLEKYEVDHYADGTDGLAATANGWQKRNNGIARRGKQK